MIFAGGCLELFHKAEVSVLFEFLYSAPNQIYFLRPVGWILLYDLLSPAFLINGGGKKRCFFLLPMQISDVRSPCLFPVSSFAFKCHHREKNKKINVFILTFLNKEFSLVFQDGFVWKRIDVHF